MSRALFFTVEGHARWFVVETTRKDKARKCGVEEFGRGGVVNVHRTTEREFEEFVLNKGREAIEKL